MGKLDELLKTSRGNIAESMGAGAAPVHGATSTTPARWQGVSKSKNAVEIPVDKLIPDPDQPRIEFEPDALERLAESLKTRGQLQPVRARWDEAKGAYVIVVGERRWRAAKMAGLSTLSAVVVEGAMAPGELLAIQMIENCLRDDLRPIEQAKAYRTLMDLHGWGVRELARELAIDHTGVARALALLELPAAVQEHVEAGTLAPASAYEVSKIPDPKEQAAVAARVVAEGLTRAETVEAVRKAASRAPANPKGRGAAGKGKIARKVTERAIRTPSGPRVSIEFRKGLDAAAIETALAEALAIVRAEATVEGPRTADAA